MTSYANELAWPGRPTILEPSAQLAIRIPNMVFGQAQTTARRNV